MLDRYLIAIRWRGFCFFLAGLIIALFNILTSPTAQAEGSRSLYPASYPTTCGTGSGQGCRANLDIQPGNKYVNRVNRLTFIYVYAEANEYILVGSRNRTASNTGIIRIYNPQSFGVTGDETVPGTADSSCSTGTDGLIDTRTKELAGPRSVNGSGNTTGYIPCSYQAPSTGIYGVVFSTGGGGGPDGIIDPPAISNNSVSAWDVTVRSSDQNSITDLNGRVFTYAWNGFTGGNNNPIYSTLYYITQDGYRYQQTQRGLDPAGFALYANSLGFLDNGQPLFKDLRGTNALVQNIINGAGLNTQIAQYPIFFSDVSPSGLSNTQVEKVLVALNIPLVPPSPTVSSVSFVGHLGGTKTTPGVGGTFTFSTTNTITYQIVIDHNAVSPTFDPANPNNAVLTGIAGGGTHTVNWDGKDNSGVNFPSSNTAYPFRVIGHNGDIHFPIIDSENNLGGGPTVIRLNGINSGSNTVYYDDRGYRTSSGNLVGNLNGTLCPTSSPAAPTNPVSLSGVDSSTAYRNWQTGTNANSDCASGAGWGDAKALDLWTYYSTAPQSGDLEIDPIIIDVATSVNAPNTATSGSTVQGSFSFANNGNNDAHSVTYSLDVSTGCSPTLTFSNLQGATASPCSVVGGKGHYTFSGWPSTLTAGAAISNMIYSYPAPASGTVTITTNITTTDTDNYPANNTDTASTGIGTVDVLTTVSVPTTAAAGSTVNGTFSFANNGANATTGGVTYTATVDSGTCPLNFQFTDLPTGVTASCASGTISFTGLPTNLAASQSFSFNFSYTMPSSGTIAVNTSIAASGDANSANNSASGSTNVSTTSISGTVFSDTDGSGIQNGAETGTNAGGLNVVIVDSANKVLAVASVGSNGAWTASVPTGTGYSAYITTASPTVGSTVTPTVALPTGWAVTGENDNGTVDGTANGILTGINASSAVSGLNFGIGQADMSVSLTNLPGTAQVGVPYSGSFSCANSGPADATNATCTVSNLPAGVTIGSCTLSPSATSWTSGTTVPVGETVTCTVSGTPTSTGSVTVTGTTGAGNDSNTANNSATKVIDVSAAPTSDLTSSISCSPNPATAGSSVSCTLTCTNSTSATAAATSASCDFSSGVPTSGVTSNSCPATANPLGVGASVSCTLTFTPSAAGQVTLTGTASATNESNTGNNGSTQDLPVEQPAPPAANNDSATTPLNTAVAITVTNNDDAASGLSLVPSTIDLDPAVSGLQTSKTVDGLGTFTLNPATGEVTFTPVTGFVGVVTIPYTLQDNLNQTSNVANITVTVRDADTNGRPLPAANDDSATTALNTPVTLSVNGNDIAGSGQTLDPATVDLDPSTPGRQTTASTSAGNWTVNNAGQVTFTPANGFTGTASLPYTIQDDAGNTSNTATIRVTVATATGLVAADDNAATTVGVPVTLNVPANDTPGTGQSLDPSTVDLDPSAPGQQTNVTTSAGSWTVNPAGQVTFTPVSGFTGPATLPYTIEDSANATSNSALITVQVNPTADPSAVADNASTTLNVPVNLTPAGNDSAAPGAVLDPSTVDLDTNTAGVQRGVITTAQGTWQVIDNAGTVTFTPASGFTGTATLNYAISDSLGHTATNTMTVTVTPADMSVSLNLPGASSPGATVTGTVTCSNSNATAALNATCAVSGATVSNCTPAVPVASLAANASISCTVTATAPSTGVLSVNASTGADNDNSSANNSTSANVLVVDAMDDGTATQAYASSGSTPYDLLGNDTVGGVAAAIGSNISAPTITSNGGLSGASINGSGQLVVPNNTAPGTYTVTYQICSSVVTTACDTATKQITVTVASLAPSISCSPNPAAVGSRVTCTLTCTNNATTAAINASCNFTGVLPNNTSSNTCPTGVSSLATGGELSCALTFTPTTTGTVPLAATVSADNDNDPSDNDTRIDVQVQTGAAIPTLSTYALLMLSALMGWLLLAQSGRLRRTRR